MEDDIGAGLAPFRGLQAEIRRAIAAPAHRLALASGTEAHQLHLGSHHEARIKTEAEMADDRITFLLVFFQEVFGTGEGHLIDVALHLIGSHADAVIGDREGLRLAIDSDRDHALRPLAAIARHGRHAAFADRIHPVAHQLPEEDFMAAINGLLDDREDVFGVNLNSALFQHRHGIRCHWRRG